MVWVLYLYVEGGRFNMDLAWVWCKVNAVGVDKNIICWNKFCLYYLGECKGEDCFVL